MNLTTKKGNEILSKAEDEDLWRFAERQTKNSTGLQYRNNVLQFCMFFNTTPFKLISLDRLEKARHKAEIEMSMQAEQELEFIRARIQRHVEKLAEQYVEHFKVKNGEYIKGKTLSPKLLNLRISALKSYLVFRGVMSNTRQFKQFKFDKTSRATRDKALLTNNQLKSMCDAADLREKCVVGLYGIHGVRPSLIPQLLIEDLKSSNDAYTPLFVNGLPAKFELEEFQWIMVKKEYVGNKGNIEFPVILTGETAEWISQHLNRRRRRGETLTLKSRIVNVPSKKSVDDIVDKLFEVIDFKGRNYLLRHKANKMLKSAYDDKDLKEWTMGHKGSIAEIYDHEHGLNPEEIAEYNASIDMTKLRIYGATSEELKIAKRMAGIARKLTSADLKQLDAIEELLNKGKLTFEQFDERLTKIIQEAQDRGMEKKFDELMRKYNEKNNSSGH